MVRAEAKAWEGKRVRTLDSSHVVPPGTEGTLRDAMAAGFKSAGYGSYGERRTPPLTDVGGWCVDMKPDDPCYSPFPVWEWDGSLEEL
jgi:hypothetical protein